MFSLKDFKKIDPELLKELTDDSGEDRTKWHMTPLGKIAAVVLGLLVAVSLIISILPTSAEQAAKKAAKSTVLTGDVQRIFTTTDAVDFAQLNYAAYVDALIRENPSALGSKPPYDRNTMLLRVEQLRPKLSQSLYQRVRANYTDAVKDGGTINRDALICGDYELDGVKAYLKMGGRETAVVSVNRVKGGAITAKFEVTVDLKQRKFTEILCL